ncbi:MAG: inositol monophosphatase family protein, partial [Pseudomonadota bacterium]
MPDPAEPGGATPAAAGAGGARGAADRDDLADLALLRDAAAEGGDIALGHARKGLSVTDKGGGQGPVTDADMAVDSHLSRRLGAARPGYGWLSEETADGPQRLTADSVFIVDPIDGTRAFIAGEDGWAVAVAVARAGRITAAVVALPARGEVYAAALGAG